MQYLSDILRNNNWIIKDESVANWQVFSLKFLSEYVVCSSTSTDQLKIILILVHWRKHGNSYCLSWTIESKEEKQAARKQRHQNVIFINNFEKVSSTVLVTLLLTLRLPLILFISVSAALLTPALRRLWSFFKFNNFVYSSANFSITKLGKMNRFK